MWQNANCFLNINSYCTVLATACIVLVSAADAVDVEAEKGLDDLDICLNVAVLNFSAAGAQSLAAVDKCGHHLIALGARIRVRPRDGGRGYVV